MQIRAFLPLAFAALAAAAEPLSNVLKANANTLSTLNCKSREAVAVPDDDSHPQP